MIDSKLIEEYQNTTYIVEEHDPQIEIRVGEIASELDKLLIENNVFTWAFITAFNPRSKALSTEENEDRHQRLLRRTYELGFRALRGKGIGDEATWVAERSLLILGIGREEAASLGQEFGQNAIVIGSYRNRSELLLFE